MKCQEISLYKIFILYSRYKQKTNLMRNFVLIFLFFSCETLEPNPKEMDLSLAREKWDNKNFNNYEYTLNVSCYCCLLYTSDAADE